MFYFIFKDFKVHQTMIGVFSVCIQKKFKRHSSTYHPEETVTEGRKPLADVIPKKSAIINTTKTEYQLTMFH